MDDNFWLEVERARQMTPEERIRRGFALFEQGSKYITERILQAFPDATPEDIRELRWLVIKRAKAFGIT